MKTSRGKDSVVDFGKAREKKLEEKRRKTERILFRQLLGIYSVTGDEKLREIELVDISEDGISFQLPLDVTDPWPTDKDDVPVRLYFSQDTYLPIQVNVQHSQSVIEDGVKFTRYGCTVDRDFKSYEAYVNFVRFLKLYSEHSHKDLGDVTIFYL